MRDSRFAGRNITDCSAKVDRSRRPMARLRAQVRTDRDGPAERCYNAIPAKGGHVDEISVIFVCLGNICRSPLAEGVFRAQVEAAGLRHRFRIDSAGTSAYHVGEPPDPGSVRVAREHGIDLSAQRARQFVEEDLGDFDYVIAMDPSNKINIERLRQRSATPLAGQLWLMRNFEESSDGSGEDRGVPDPWGGGAHGFEAVYDLVDRSCRHLLAHIRSQEL